MLMGSTPLSPEILTSYLDEANRLAGRKITQEGFRDAAGNRSVLFSNLGITLRDAGIGYVAGIVLALVVACIFVLAAPLEQTFLPVDKVGSFETICTPLRNSG